MKKGRRTAALLAVIIAGSMLYGARPADAKGLLTKLGMKIDEISIVLSGKDRGHRKPDYRPAPPPPPPPRHEPPRPVSRPMPEPHRPPRNVPHPPPPPHGRWGR